MSTLPFLSPVAAYAGKVGGGAEGMIGAHQLMKNRGGGGEFFCRRSTEEVGVGYVERIEKGRYREKEGGGVGEMGVSPRMSNVMVSGGNSSPLSSIGRGDGGWGGGDNTPTVNRKRSLVVEVPREMEVGRCWDSGGGTMSEQSMGLDPEMAEEHLRRLSVMRRGSNWLFMSPHQDVHNVATSADGSGSNFVAGINNRPLYMNDHQHQHPHYQNAAYYPTGMESGGIMRLEYPNMTGETPRNYTVEEVMGIKRGKTRGNPSIKRDNFITKCDERHDDVNKGGNSLPENNIPVDSENMDNDRKRKLDLKKKLDAAVVLRSLKVIPHHVGGRMMCM